MDGLEALAADVVEEFARRGIRSVRYVPQRSAIEIQEPDRSGTIFLTGLLDAVTTDPLSRTDRIADAVTGFLTHEVSSLPWADAQHRLRPVLRWATFGHDEGEVPAVPIHRPALPFVAEFVVIDHPGGMQYVVDGGPGRDWAISDTEAFAVARRALASRTIHLRPDERPRPLHVGDEGTSYLVSHLLLDGWLAGLAAHVGGRPVAFAPDQNTLIVGADGADELPGLFEMAVEAYRGSRKKLSTMPYTVDGDGRLVPYRVPAGHPLEQPVKRAECMLASDVYAVQKRILDEEDLYEIVAPYNAIRQADGRHLSYASWVTDSPTLLPQVDRVVLVGTDGSGGSVPFAELLADGRVEEAVEYDPVRYRTL